MKKTLLLMAVLAWIAMPLAAQSITVTAPDSRYSWCIGTVPSIQWTTSGVTGNVDIILRRAGDDSAPPVMGIAANTANDGSEGWVVPASVAPGNYVVRIRSTASPGVYDDSESFVIKDCSLGDIIVFMPKSGKLKIGSTCSIQWQSTGVAGKVDIILRPANAPNAPPALGIASGTDNDGIEAWIIPAAVAPGQYLIRVRSLTTPSVYDDSQVFEIVSGAALINLPPLDRIPPLAMKFPRLAVSDIDLTPNAEGFGIIFSYKNTGSGPLPKASEIPVKPSYRVLIDGRETASGSLFIPAFPAQPGWEQTGYFGGWIVLPSPMDAYGSNWHIGNTITVHINENKAMGMDSHTLSLNLKPIALKYKFDLVRNGISLNWSTRVLTVYLRLDGNVPSGRELFVYCGRDAQANDYFMVKMPARPGSVVVSKKVDFPSHYNKVTFYLNSYVTIPNLKQVWDMDYRNNNAVKLEFTRPNSNPEKETIVH